MANTYVQNYFHIVFAVKERKSLLEEEYEKLIYKQIKDCAESKRCKVYAVNGTSNHIHILASIHPTISLSSFVQSIKIQSSLVYRKRNPFFEWQNGYAAFSYSKSLTPTVIRYIENQKSHHQKQAFGDEIESLLKKAGFEIDKRNMLEDIK